MPGSPSPDSGRGSGGVEDSPVHADRRRSLRRVSSHSSLEDEPVRGGKRRRLVGSPSPDSGRGSGGVEDSPVHADRRRSLRRVSSHSSLEDEPVRGGKRRRLVGSPSPDSGRGSGGVEDSPVHADRRRSLRRVSSHSSLEDEPVRGGKRRRLVGSPSPDSGRGSGGVEDSPVHADRRRSLRRVSSHSSLEDEPVRGGKRRRLVGSPSPDSGRGSGGVEDSPVHADRRRSLRRVSSHSSLEDEPVRGGKRRRLVGSPSPDSGRGSGGVEDSPVHADRRRSLRRVSSHSSLEDEPVRGGKRRRLVGSPSPDSGRGSGGVEDSPVHADRRRSLRRVSSHSSLEDEPVRGGKRRRLVGSPSPDSGRGSGGVEDSPVHADRRRSLRRVSSHSSLEDEPVRGGKRRRLVGSPSPDSGRGSGGVEDSPVHADRRRSLRRVSSHSSLEDEPVRGGKRRRLVGSPSPDSGRGSGGVEDSPVHADRRRSLRRVSSHSSLEDEPVRGGKRRRLVGSPSPDSGRGSGGVEDSPVHADRRRSLRRVSSHSSLEDEPVRGGKRRRLVGSPSPDSGRGSGGVEDSPVHADRRRSLRRVSSHSSLEDEPVRGGKRRRLVGSPSPDSGRGSGGVEDSPVHADRRRSLRRVSSHSSLEDEPVRGGKRRRLVGSPSPDSGRGSGGVEDSPVHADRRRSLRRVSSHSSLEDEPVRSGKRRRAVVESSSGSESEGPLTKAKSSKDQLRQVRSKRLRPAEESDEDEEDTEYRAPAASRRSVRERSWSPEAAPSAAPRPKATQAQLKARCLQLFNTALEEELSRVPRVNARTFPFIADLRPFASFHDLISRLDETKGLSSEMALSAVDQLKAEAQLEKILEDCERETEQLAQAVEYLKAQTDPGDPIAPDHLTNPELQLKSYQVVGVRWLHLMSGQRLNAVLADEMGLGKTVQIIAFLALLKQLRKPSLPNQLHLIVVPSSTIDNWFTELHKWWPEVGVLNYYGSQEDRAFIRQDVHRRIDKAAQRPDMALDDDDRPLDVLLTTYNMIISKPEDRKFLRKITITYAVFDEAHMLKNAATKRYKDLVGIRAQRKILLTGTPLQNNLVELMSLMGFVMPAHLAPDDAKTSEIFGMFKTQRGSSYETDKIRQAKQILRPFVLRRLKKQVLTQLPEKLEEVISCPMTDYQAEVYASRVGMYRAAAAGGDGKANIGVLVQLRKAANHPLLHRHHYTTERLAEMAETLVNEEASLKDSAPEVIREELAEMSDFDIHKDIANKYVSLKPFRLPTHLLFESGKIRQLDKLLPKFRQESKKVLLFSQFVIVLDVLEEYLRGRGLGFLRLDGRTPVVERQSLIDEFSHDPTLAVFLLSTRAGGLGINLTAAEVIILHDMDYNPYNDRQAEDRAHRLGQQANVRVVKLVAEGSVEEGILKAAQAKLHLERQVTGRDEAEAGGEDKENRQASMERLLNEALGF